MHQHLKDAIDTNDLERVQELLTRDPELHKAPLGYANDGPLTWAAECRVPYEPPSDQRLAIADWMIRNGSDIHQGGDGPLARAALNSDRIPMMELLVSHGANVNAVWHGTHPILFFPCETLDAESLKWLLAHGADPNCNAPETALDYLIASYVRNPARLQACIEVLLKAGGRTRYDAPSVWSILRGRLDLLQEQLRADPALVTQCFPELDFGTTGGRMLTLKGATLLHVAAEYGSLEGARLLLDHGADVNARATIDGAGVGGQTALFHAAAQFGDTNSALVNLLIERGADLSLQAKLPGHYERPGETVQCTPLEYAALFPGV